MQTESNRLFGNTITRLINKEDLTREEAREAFITVLNDRTTPMQQGAFLAALTAKKETAGEVAGAWEAIYELDTSKVNLNESVPVVENSGTGMDTFKTFNISTAASLIAASGGVKMARHGARAITSRCGTVDMCEALGVDVECRADLVARSVESAGIGLFNGMSPEIHPLALGRILSQIFFGSTLNIAASLANPALPKLGIRGVYSPVMIRPVAEVMKAIGYQRAIVLYGSIDGSDKGMDEASVCGPTQCAELHSDGTIREYGFSPEDFDLGRHDPAELAPGHDLASESRRFVKLLLGKDTPARSQAAILNAGLIYYVSGLAQDIMEGIQKAAVAQETARAFTTLETWVRTQNREPQAGLKTLERLV